MTLAARSMDDSGEDGKRARPLWQQNGDKEQHPTSHRAIAHVRAQAAVPFGLRTDT